MDVNAEQPAPAASAGPAVWELVIEDMKARDQLGQSRYGTRLRPFNGRAALVDAYQEALDLTVYLRQEIWERAAPRIDAVYLDLDGVLVDFVGAALRAHGQGWGVLTAGEWHIERCMGISPQMFWAECQGHAFWSGLEWTVDGRAILEAVRGCGLPFWLLTSHSDDHGSCSGKYAWVSARLPDLRRRLILCPDKAAVARPGAMLIDDADHNCDAWRDAGGTAVLVPRIWNSYHKYRALAADYVRERVRDVTPRPEARAGGAAE